MHRMAAGGSSSGPDPPPNNAHLISWLIVVMNRCAHGAINGQVQSGPGVTSIRASARRLVSAASCRVKAQWTHVLGLRGLGLRLEARLQQRSKCTGVTDQLQLATYQAGQSS